METAEPSLPLMGSVLYRLQTNIDFVTTSGFADDYFSFFESPYRPNAALEKDTDIKVAEILHFPMPNSPDSRFSLRPPVTALPSAPQQL